VTPLLLEHGAAVTTARMAEAAQVAEGTIFRVFPDKPTLLHEAVQASLDPGPVLTGLAEMDAGADLEKRMRHATGILAERINRVHSLISLVRSLAPSRPKMGGEAVREAREANRRILEALTLLLDPVAEELSVAPDRAAVALNGLMFAIHFPFTEPEDRLDTDEAVAILLDGIRNKDSRERENA
jgi:AcrR family transcriptional regulator